MSSKELNVTEKENLKDSVIQDLEPNIRNLHKLAYLSPLTLTKVHSLTLKKKNGGEYKRQCYQFLAHQSDMTYNFLIPFEDQPGSKYKTPFEIWDFVARISALIDIKGWSKVIQAEKISNNITGIDQWRWVTPEQKSI